MNRVLIIFPINLIRINIQKKKEKKEGASSNLHIKFIVILFCDSSYIDYSNFLTHLFNNHPPFNAMMYNKLYIDRENV